MSTSCANTDKGDMMDRRSFLKGAVGFSTGGMTALLLPGLQLGALADAASSSVQATVLGRVLRGTRDGQIFEFLANDQNWHRIAKFGTHCAIVSIRESQGQIQAEIAVQGYRFVVKSADARLWRLVS
jgi:hypothetical protein